MRNLLILGLVLTFSCQSPEVSEDWHYLFDGKNLDQWETYLGPQFTPGLDGEDLQAKPPIGLNKDSLAVFSIVELEGEPVLRISGQLWGGIFTQAEFENYHLQLQFKWGKKKWYPRENEKRDSGLLYHGVGKHGEGDLFWLKSQEFQIQEGDCGDFWGVAGTIIDVRAEQRADGEYYYSPQGELLSFYDGGTNGRNCKKDPDAEKPSGEWNTVDLYCVGASSAHVMNGTLTMFLQNSRHKVDEQEVPLTKGKIELQSESAEVYYKQIRTRPITAMPAAFTER